MRYTVFLLGCAVLVLPACRYHRYMKDEYRNIGTVMYRETVTVRTEPPGCRLYLHENYKGRTPVDVSINLRAPGLVIEQHGEYDCEHWEMIDFSLDVGRMTHRERKRLGPTTWDQQTRYSFGTRHWTFTAHKDGYSSTTYKLQLSGSDPIVKRTLANITPDNLPSTVTGRRSILITLKPLHRSHPRVPPEVKPPPPKPKPKPKPKRILYEYERHRPRIYDDATIKEVALLGFDNRHITDEVAEVLVKNSKWRVIDRDTLDRLMREQDIQATDRFDAGTAVQLGRLAGVQAVIFGEYYGTGLGRADRAVLKVINVETAEYLVYETLDMVDFNKTDPARYSANAKLICRYLVPSCMKMDLQAKYPIQIWVGKGTDKMTFVDERR